MQRGSKTREEERREGGSNREEKVTNARERIKIRETISGWEK